MKAKINKNLTKRIIKYMIWSLASYGAETGTMSRKDIGNFWDVDMPYDGKKESS